MVQGVEHVCAPPFLLPLLQSLHLADGLRGVREAERERAEEEEDADAAGVPDEAALGGGAVAARAVSPNRCPSISRSGTNSGSLGSIPRAILWSILQVPNTDIEFNFVCLFYSTTNEQQFLRKIKYFCKTFFTPQLS